MLVKWFIPVLVIGIVTAPTLASAQYNPNSTSVAIPEQQEECKRLGIKVEKCSDIEIAKHRCLGPNCGKESSPPMLDPITISIITVSGIALVAGVFAVKKISILKSESASPTFYKIIAVSMIVIGSALSAFSIWSMVTPKIMCQDNLGCNIDPYFYVSPIQNDFIVIILSICLISFGAVIYGMIIRLGR